MPGEALTGPVPGEALTGPGLTEAAPPWGSVADRGMLGNAPLGGGMRGIGPLIARSGIGSGAEETDGSDAGGSGAGSSADWPGVVAATSTGDSGSGRRTAAILVRWSAGATAAGGPGAAILVG